MGVLHVILAGEVMRKRLRWITQEVSTLSTSLPAHLDSTILLAVDVERMDVLRACFFPPPDTPYAHGAFLFDIFLPPEYPDKPPMVSREWIGKHFLVVLVYIHALVCANGGFKMNYAVMSIWTAQTCRYMHDIRMQALQVSSHPLPCL